MSAFLASDFLSVFVVPSAFVDEVSDLALSELVESDAVELEESLSVEVIEDEELSDAVFDFALAPWSFL